MCDETTGLAAEAQRSRFDSFAAAPLPAGLSETLVEIATADGTCDAYFVHPSDGRHPGVLLWPDAVGLRDAKKQMAARLAAEGYAVLAVNPYYRAGRAPFDIGFATFATEEGRAKMKELTAGLYAGVASDAAAHLAFLDEQDAVDGDRGLGVQGYCMGGNFAMQTVVRHPWRIRAVASFHGAGLVSDQPVSLHRQIGATQASYLFAIGQDDDAKAPGDKDALREAAAAAGRPARIDVYPADHGWCVIDAPMYDHAEAEKAWARLLELYAEL